LRHLHVGLIFVLKSRFSNIVAAIFG
jgi:hypothetical protein